MGNTVGGTVGGSGWHCGHTSYHTHIVPGLEGCDKDVCCMSDSHLPAYLCDCPYILLHLPAYVRDRACLHV